MGGRNPTYDELEGLSLVKELFGSIISGEEEYRNKKCVSGKQQFNVTGRTCLFLAYER